MSELLLPVVELLFFESLEVGFELKAGEDPVVLEDESALLLELLELHEVLVVPQQEREGHAGVQLRETDLLRTARVVRQVTTQT